VLIRQGIKSIGGCAGVYPSYWQARWPALRYVGSATVPTDIMAGTVARLLLRQGMGHLADALSLIRLIGRHGGLPYEGTKHCVIVG